MKMRSAMESAARYIFFLYLGVCLLDCSQTCEISFLTEAASLMVLAGRNASLLCDATSCLSEQTEGDVFYGNVDRLRVVWKDPSGREVSRLPSRVFSVQYYSAPMNRLMLVNAGHDIEGQYRCSVMRNGVVIQEQAIPLIVFDPFGSSITSSTTTRRPAPRGRRRGDQIIEGEDDDRRRVPFVLVIRPVRSAQQHGSGQSQAENLDQGAGLVVKHWENSPGTTGRSVAGQRVPISDTPITFTEIPPGVEPDDRSRTTSPLLNILFQGEYSRLHRKPAITLNEVPRYLLSSHELENVSDSAGLKSIFGLNQMAANLRYRREAKNPTSPALDTQTSPWENTTPVWFGTNTETSAYSQQTTQHITQNTTEQTMTQTTNSEFVTEYDITADTDSKNETESTDLTQTVTLFVYIPSVVSSNTTEPDEADSTTATSPTSEASTSTQSELQSTSDKGSGGGAGSGDCATMDPAMARPQWPSRQESFFGRHGAVAFAVTLAVAILLLYALVMIIFMPRMLAACRSKSTTLNGAEDRKAIYRKRNTGIEEAAPMTFLTDGNPHSSEIVPDEDTALSSQSENKSFEADKDGDYGQKPAVSTFLLRQGSQMENNNKTERTPSIQVKEDAGQKNDSRRQSGEGIFKPEEISLDLSLDLSPDDGQVSPVPPRAVEDIGGMKLGSTSREDVVEL
ncbi:hypothetical protein EGW08_008497 [Elysia chlorotica]|uniref:Ig-like domain-containing protein n=1 Tax=Elysia chlorotica TaxID=188477 RepID=A0A3S1BGZ8_ELYCH|nr:hypothetical protein EGW08_008497 [Elysia chlorotica]